MPQAKPKASEIAAEAKRTYMPYIEQHMPQYPVRSFLHVDSTSTAVSPESRSKERLRVAVIDGDPVDVALDWYQYNQASSPTHQQIARIPVVNVANEKRAGGDWESGLMGSEECFARRSNLVHALVTSWYPYTASSASHYPIPQRGGIYSPYVVVFRDGPEQYEVWSEFKSLPVITVAPVRRPKLDESGTKYSFEQEKDLMMDKMRTVLRIAAAWKHRDICIGGFGTGPIFRNPVEAVANMWKFLLFEEEEFIGAFSNVVFAIESSPAGHPKGGGTSDCEVFKEVFDPSNVFPTLFR